MQGIVLLTNRTRRYHGVPLLVSRFNNIEILLFEKLALCGFFPSLERNYVRDFFLILGNMFENVFYIP